MPYVAPDERQGLVDARLAAAEAELRAEGFADLAARLRGLVHELGRWARPSRGLPALPSQGTYSMLVLDGECACQLLRLASPQKRPAAGTAPRCCWAR